jgi:hypothetical protein
LVSLLDGLEFFGSLGESFSQVLSCWISRVLGNTKAFIAKAGEPLQQQMLGLKHSHA